ncbi:MAG: copper chaperone PCu(A)C [Chromatiales bacterium]|nr:copper chaperone PCu(A)C [Chromatiales bacterium]
MKKILTAVVATIALTTSSALLAKSAAESVMVQDPYARAMPPGQPNSGSFMTFKNMDSVDHAVVDAKSPVSKVVELHTHIHENGMMMMRRIDKIDIPANGETVLKPGGLHVMFIGLKQDLVVGKKVPVTLIFEDGSKKEIEAPVRKIMMKMKSMPGMKMHKMH